jgi:glycosyltransferase involved in cell wall biosynthesis
MKVSKSEYLKKFKDKKCCVLIPTYNNATTIKMVIANVLEYCSDVYVINDGCTDNTLSVISEFNTSIKCIGYKVNRGKGNAIIFGFRKAIEDGFEYAITIDSDGQHFAHDLPTFVDLIDQEPNSVIIGARPLARENLSAGSSFANKFSNFWIKIETGISLDDTQSGYRLYPLAPIRKMKFFTRKYEFEIEVIVRLSWRGCKVINVPIDVFYPKKGERISHYRPFKDFLRISTLNTILVSLAILFFLPRNIVRKNKNKTIKKIIKEEILGVGTPLKTIALSIGFGIFMGIVPIWGYQLAVGFTLAHLFRLNKSIFFVFANISLPPFIPIILYLSYIFGGFIMGKGMWFLSIEDISFKTMDLKQYIIGSFALAITAGTLTGSVSYFVLLLRNKKNGKLFNSK